MDRNLNTGAQIKEGSGPTLFDAVMGMTELVQQLENVVYAPMPLNNNVQEVDPRDISNLAELRNRILDNNRRLRQLFEKLTIIGA